ncbi:hypothetical protein [Rhizobium mayense]|uniref:Lipoprotein n=1 Tax=Rhizobium mayense TaxID=1312184 RepID=A0ABT7JTK0_9HYPH|nr:hypothetical protein [Rhizobium mayense]MDL2398483.1 hypothetical protein [Rhizobium mayense]
MKYLHILAIASVLASLAACTPEQRAQKSEAVKTALQGSPALRENFYASCRSGNITAKQKQAIATMANVSASDPMAVVCRRVVNGLTAGKITSEEVETFVRTQVPSPNLIKVVQGR